MPIRPGEEHEALVRPERHPAGNGLTPKIRDQALRALERGGQLVHRIAVRIVAHAQQALAVQRARVGENLRIVRQQQ